MRIQTRFSRFSSGEALDYLGKGALLKYEFCIALHEALPIIKIKMQGGISDCVLWSC